MPYRRCNTGGAGCGGQRDRCPRCTSVFTHQYVAIPGAARCGIEEVVISALRVGRVAVRTGIACNELHRDAVRDVGRMPGSAQLRRVATDVEKRDVAQAVGLAVVVILAAQLVEVPAELLAVHVVVEDALVLLEAVRGRLRSGHANQRDSGDGTGS